MKIHTSWKRRALIIVIVVVAISGLIGGYWTWYLKHTASGIRIRKDFVSQVDNGIPREIKVYNPDGKVIMDEKGKFDIKHTNRSLQYVDQNNHKHNIYFGDNTTVTVDELK
nr:hypothetical protein [Limosilactobacillus mucosae]